MPHGSQYGSGVVIVQDRQYRPSSTYTSGSYASRTSAGSSSSSGGGYYYSSSNNMDSRRSSSSRSSSSSNGGRDYTGTYRSGGADGYLTTAKHNTKGKHDVVIIHHNKGYSDPDAPRSSERRRA